MYTVQYTEYSTLAKPFLNSTQPAAFQLAVQKYKIPLWSSWLHFKATWQREREESQFSRETTTFVNRSTTLMLIVVILVFLATEIPLMVITVLHTLHQRLGTGVPCHRETTHGHHCPPHPTPEVQYSCSLPQRYHSLLSMYLLQHPFHYL